MEVESENIRSEVELIGRIVSGKADEYRHIVTAYQDRIFALIMRQVGNRAVADELTQDSFIRAYRSLPSFRFESKFSTWLTRIALNVTNNYFTSKRYQETKQQSDLDLTELEATTERGDDFLDEHLRQLQYCIADLAPRQREVVVLCCLEEKSYEEAGAILGVPSGTVGSRLNKAFQILRTKFWNG